MTFRVASNASARSDKVRLGTNGVGDEVGAKAAQGVGAVPRRGEEQLGALEVAEERDVVVASAPTAGEGAAWEEGSEPSIG